MSSSAVAAGEPYAVDVESRGAPAPVLARDVAVEQGQGRGRVEPMIVGATVLVLQLAWFVVLGYGLFRLA